MAGVVPGPSSAHGSRCPAHEASQRLSYRPPPSDDDTPSPGNRQTNQVKSSSLLRMKMTPAPQVQRNNEVKSTTHGPLSRTTQVSQYQKGKTNLDITEARDSEWQWHQLGRMQVCTSLQTDNHASTPTLSFFCRPNALPAAQTTALKEKQNTMKTNYRTKYTGTNIDR